MIENSWIFSLLPGAVALICLSLLYKLFKNQSQIIYKKLFFNLFVLDACMSCAYIVFHSSRKAAEWLADGYLIALYFLCANLLVVAVSLSDRSTPSRIINSIYILPLVLTALHLAGFMVESYRVERNSLVHNDGQLSWIKDIYLLMSLVLTTTVFTVNIRKSQDKQLVSKNILALTAFLITILSLFIVVLLSTTKYPLPAFYLMPVSTLASTCIFYLISRHKVIDLSIGMHNVYKRSIIAIKYVANTSDAKALRDIHNEQEKQLIKEALEQESVAKDAAKHIDMPATTFHGKVKKHGLVSRAEDQD